MSEVTLTNREPQDADLHDWLQLALVGGVGPRTITQLLEQFGSPAAVLDAAPSRLREVPGVGPKLSRAIGGARQEIDAEAELALCRANGIDILTLQHAQYPRMLREIADPPPTLFVSGQLTAADAVSIGIVGTRHASRYGIKQADRLARSLSNAGLTVACP